MSLTSNPGQTFLKLLRLLPLVLLLFGNIASGQQLYWSSHFNAATTELFRVNANGTNNTAIFPATEKNIEAITVDPRDGKIYYGRGAATFTISRMNANGTGNQQLYNLHALDPLLPSLPNSTATPRGLSIDTVHNKLYWTSSFNDGGDGSLAKTFIQRSNLDGTNVETVLTGLNGSLLFVNLVVNGSTNKMYWTNAKGAVQAANIDGTNIQTLYQSPDRLWALAADFDHGKLFWSQVAEAGQGVYTSNLDGSNPQRILSHPDIPGPFNDSGYRKTFGLAVDPSTSKLYYNEAFGFDGINHIELPGNVSKMNYDGSQIERVVSSANYPFAMAIVPIPEPSSYIAIACMAFFFIAVKKKTRFKK